VASAILGSIPGVTGGRDKTFGSGSFGLVAAWCGAADKRLPQRVRA